jgi:hypothetical protein
MIHHKLTMVMKKIRMAITFQELTLHKATEMLLVELEDMVVWVLKVLVT